ncbi:TRAFAC clade GTPase domain-containing protein [Roseofilum casamattae]|uniref:Double-GTPase 2 domain-containing protein n=1 Tax=Roseofilum casamattae BLCC-M143 TaxID=3022442 RepID=A0ABT7BTM6_9CYAN|nr:hypothetical protein [Roseofilum casamattae]MDJ1182535.1 hypothetical protein [Roseofilum casamattae BLCC-M143]
MSDKVKITMLGTTGSGKTCYMIGMYAYMAIGYNGLTFHAKNLDLDLELSNRYDNLVDNKGEDRWPPPTQLGESKNYVFSLNYGFKPVIDFEWWDYRGGALKDQENKEDTQALFKNIKDSSSLFISISGEYLKDQKGAQKLRSAVRRVNTLINKLLSSRSISPENPYPVAVVVTKFDLCKDLSKEEIIDRVQGLFQGFFTENSGFFVMICPVSLGLELADNPSQGQIEPINLALPVFFAVYSEFKQQYVARKNKLSSEKTKVSNLQTGRIRQWFKRSEIRDGKERIKSLGNEIEEEIEPKLRLLCRELRKVTLFLNGQEVEIDD